MHPAFNIVLKDNVFTLIVGSGEYFMNSVLNIHSASNKNKN